MLGSSQVHSGPDFARKYKYSYNLAVPPSVWRISKNLTWQTYIWEKGKRNPTGGKQALGKNKKFHPHQKIQGGRGHIKKEKKNQATRDFWSRVRHAWIVWRELYPAPFWVIAPIPPSPPSTTSVEGGNPPYKSPPLSRQKIHKNGFSSCIILLRQGLPSVKVLGSPNGNNVAPDVPKKRDVFEMGGLRVLVFLVGWDVWVCIGRCFDYSDTSLKDHLY